jgi:hypothetical protein
MTCATKLRAGLYRLDGVTCKCGGELRAERVGSHAHEFAWETFCVKCLTCDPNGWRTLRDCIRLSPGHFSQKHAAKGED